MDSQALLSWFDANERDLPWRRPGTSAWGVLLSEVMSQQTPVARVAPVWEDWMRRWPTPADFAQATRAEVLRAWGKLGYPRRALPCGSARRLLARARYRRTSMNCCACLALGITPRALWPVFTSG